MITTDWLQLLYLLGAAVAGWLIRHHFGTPLSSSTSTPQPAGAPTLQDHPILDFLHQLSQSRQQSDEMLNLLRQLVNGEAKPTAPPVPVAAKTGNS